MGGISIQKRLEIDQKKVKAKMQRRADLLAEVERLNGEIKVLQASIAYNEKKYNRIKPIELYDEAK